MQMQSIRVGYMILPEKYLGIYKKNVGEFSCTVPVLEQYVLAEFIDKGYFEQHLNRVRRKKNLQPFDYKFFFQTNPMKYSTVMATITTKVDMMNPWSIGFKP